MKILGILGDSSFLEYGGTVVYQDKDSDTVNALHFEPMPDDAGEDQTGLVYLNQYSIERRKLVHDDDGRPYYVPAWYDIDKDQVRGPSTFGEWWDSRLGEMCQSMDVEPAEFRRLECSVNPLENAAAMEIVGGYFGYAELSAGYETTEKASEWARKLALPLYQARKAGRIA